MASKGKRFWENRFVDKAKDSTNIVDSTTRETVDEKRIRVRSLWIMNIEIFIFALGFSIVLTGVLPYLKQVRNYTLTALTKVVENENQFLVILYLYITFSVDSQQHRGRNIVKVWYQHGRKSAWTSDIFANIGVLAQ